jgi:hypothetical protein
VVPRYSLVDATGLTEVTASAADQFAGAWPEAERPALSWLLLHPDTEGPLTLADGVEQAERRLRTLPDRRQTPQLYGSGDVLLGELPSVPLPAPVTKRSASVASPDVDRPRKQTGWKILGGTAGVGAVVMGLSSLERRRAATRTDYPSRVTDTVQAARTNAAVAWTLTGLSAASFTLVVVR